jgi:predicted RNA-binding protein YlqC (UPF0109 family)
MEHRTEMNLIAEPPMTQAELMLRAILASLCKYTPEPLIEFSQERQSFIIQVDGRDQGRIIGKKGTNIWALNALMWYAGTASYRYPLKLEVLEPVFRQRPPDMPYQPNPSWDIEAIKDLVRTIVEGCFGHVHHGFEVIKHRELGDVTIKGETYLPHLDPDIGEALKVIIRAAGLAIGANLTVYVHWE